MKLPIVFPARLGPGQSWRVPEDKLDVGLQIGSVCTARTSGGHEAQFLVDAAYRKRDGLRYYDLVRLADRIELRDAQLNLDALISHVSRTGQPVTLTIDGADAATLLPRSAPRPHEKRVAEEFHARVAGGRLGRVVPAGVWPRCRCGPSSHQGASGEAARSG
jgi:antitoxin (DNA-binding transcriptional repressor) of toxin-antitoxin stability system